MHPLVSNKITNRRAFLKVFFYECTPWVSNIITNRRAFLKVFFYKCRSGLDGLLL